jgi:CheY-like chemotaxis protein
MSAMRNVSITGHPTSAPTPVAAGGRRGRILIVDDDRLFATAMERCLAPEHEVVALHSADDALRLLDGGARFDLIFCDLAMPDMSGMDFFAALTSRFREHAMRTVFLTGGAFSDEVRAFLESVSNPCLEKPFDVQKLTQLTREWVGPGRPDATTSAPRSA